MSGSATASVEVLTAEVRTLMVGKRQVTMSVFRQLDFVPDDECEPFGRICNDKDDSSAVWVVGRHAASGALVRSRREKPAPPATWRQSAYVSEASGWFKVGPSSGLWDYIGSDWERVDGSSDDGDPSYTCGPWTLRRSEIPKRPSGARIATKGEYRYVVDMPPDAPLDVNITPGRWAYSSPEARLVAESMAVDALSVVTKAVEQYYEWAALPLIVLAGLR